jgi:hypothetical protein
MEPLESVRSLLKSHRARAASEGYPAEVRARVGRYAAARRADGDRVSAIALDLGISTTSITKWASAVVRPPPLQLVPVEVVPDVLVAPTILAPVTRRVPTGSAVCSPTLVSPRGFRVEGLDVEALYTLLGRLG